MEIVNLTPHAVNIVGITLHGKSTSEVLVLPPSGKTARILTDRTPIWYMESRPGCHSIPICKSEHRKIVDLPPYKEGVLLLVSLAVRLSLPNRKDLVSPGDLFRNAENQPIGCYGLDINY